MILMARPTEYHFHWRNLLWRSRSLHWFRRRPQRQFGLQRPHREVQRHQISKWYPLLTPPLHHPVLTHWIRQLTTNPSPQAFASKQSTTPLAASKASPTKTSSSPPYRNTASSSNRTTRTGNRPVLRALAFPSLISRLRAFRVRWLQARRMCISFVGVVRAAVSGRGRGLMSWVGRRLLPARMSPAALLARMLAIRRLLLQRRMLFDAVACRATDLDSLA